MYRYYDETKPVLDQLQELDEIIFEKRFLRS